MLYTVFAAVMNKILLLLINTQIVLINIQSVNCKVSNYSLPFCHEFIQICFMGIFRYTLSNLYVVEFFIIFKDSVLLRYKCLFVNC